MIVDKSGMEEVKEVKLRMLMPLAFSCPHWCCSWRSSPGVLLVIVRTIALIIWKRRQVEVVTVSRSEVWGTYELGGDFSTATGACDYYAAGGDTGGDQDH